MTVRHDKLRSQIPDIAARLLSVPHLFPRESVTELVAYVTEYIDLLLAASLLGRARLFSDYVGWHQSVNKARNVPLEKLSRTLQEIRRAAAECGDPSEHGLVDTIDQALARLSHAERPGTADPTDETLGGLAKKYLDLLLIGQRHEALSLVRNALSNGLSLEDLYMRVLQPAMFQIGRLWERNQITVAQEHYVSAATQVIISQLYPLLLEGPRYGKVMVGACVASNLHEIGLRFVCDMFEMRGWDTHFYGANTPTPDLIQAIRSRSPHIIALSATIASQLPPVLSFIQTVRADESLRKIPILVGGAAFRGNEDLWKEMGANGYAADALSAVTLANEISEGSTHA